MHDRPFILFVVLALREAIADDSNCSFLKDELELEFKNNCFLLNTASGWTIWPWAKERVTQAFTPQAQTALLRVRLALDAGLWL